MDLLPELFIKKEHDVSLKGERRLRLVGAGRVPVPGAGSVHITRVLGVDVSVIRRKNTCSKQQVK